MNPYKDTENKNMKKEDCNKALLNAIYKNALMASSSIEDFLDSVTDDKFKAEISRQNDQYSLIINECKMLAKAGKYKLEEIGPLTRAKTWTSLKISILLNNNTRHFAHMMYIGTNMGIPDILFALTDHKNADKEIVELANKLLTLEEENITKLKKYLKLEENMKDKKADFTKEKHYAEPEAKNWSEPKDNPEAEHPHDFKKEFNVLGKKVTIEMENTADDEKEQALKTPREEAEEDEKFEKKIKLGKKTIELEVEDSDEKKDKKDKKKK